ncbi:MAG: hypothetical protein LQ343_005461 [Gyalolechia ehrenbergii]|nr:MAG: hypothetical protein LQ343_005461 [Gyalolechia ehrenbergii]
MDRLTLKERATDFLKFANALSDELTILGLPEPSFEHGLTAALHSDAPDSRAGAARQDLLQLVDELRALLTEPTLLLTAELASIFRQALLLSLHSLVRLRVAENFPPQGSTVLDLALTMGLKEGLLRRLLSHCATHHIYYQASQDFFVHMAASRALAENEGMRKWILIGAEELIPATLKTAEALVNYPNSEEPEHSGWNLQNATDLAMPSRGTVFAGAMTYHAKLPGFSPAYLVSTFPWGSIKSEINVVDVGGGLGHVSKALIAHSPQVKRIVQDSPGVVAQAQEEKLPANLQGQISFQSHDFFDPQPVKDADVYLLRLVLHDWSDKYAVMIIQALIPALKPGAKVIVNDRVLPAPGKVHYLLEREGRDYDIYILTFQNAKERTAEDWKTLFRVANERFKVGGVKQPPKSALQLSR